jgi:hypothetical protein
MQLKVYLHMPEDKITFRTEIEFIGSIEEFTQVAEALVKLPIRLRVEWPPDHTAGCWPLPLDQLLSRSFIKKVIADRPRFVIPDPGIYGGIRPPHLHVKNEIVLLDRSQFKDLVGRVAHELAGRIAERADYTETVDAIRHLAVR